MEFSKTKTRIAIVSPAYPYRGGQALVESHLYHLLTESGYDCYTVTYTLLYPSVFFPGKTQFDHSEKIYFEHSQRIYRLINSISPLSWIRAVKKLVQLQPEIIVIVWWMPFFGPCLGTISWLCKKLLQTKIVFLVENYLSHENRWFDRLLTLQTLKLADHIIVESQYIKDEYIHSDFPATPVHQTNVPVFDCFNTGRYTRESARVELGIDEKNVVLFFGYIRPYKGLKNLLRCFEDVLQEYPDTKLLIVGEFYEDRERYSSLIKNLKLEQKTKVISRYVPNEEVELYFKAADLTCMPYDSATQSGVLMLSYGFRRPVVVTDVAGLPEFVENGKTGLVVEKGNCQQLAAAINQILKSKEGFDFEKAIEQYVLEIGNNTTRRIFEDILRAEES